MHAPACGRGPVARRGFYVIVINCLCYLCELCKQFAQKTELQFMFCVPHENSLSD
jgi:hypothetical protein